MKSEIRNKKNYIPFPSQTFISKNFIRLFDIFTTFFSPNLEINSLSCQRKRKRKCIDSLLWSKHSKFYSTRAWKKKYVASFKNHRLISIASFFFNWCFIYKNQDYFCFISWSTFKESFFSSVYSNFKDYFRMAWSFTNSELYYANFFIFFSHKRFQLKLPFISIFLIILMILKLVYNDSLDFLGFACFGTIFFALYAMVLLISL